MRVPIDTTVRAQYNDSAYYNVPVGTVPRTSKTGLRYFGPRTVNVRRPDVRRILACRPSGWTSETSRPRAFACARWSVTQPRRTTVVVVVVTAAMMTIAR